MKNFLKAFLICLPGAVLGVLMTSIGFSIFTWQWWMIIVSTSILFTVTRDMIEIMEES